jgi:hypothetical protein
MSKIISILIITHLFPLFISRNIKECFVYDNPNLQTKITKKQAIRIAENKFRNYLPIILQTHENSVLDLKSSFYGDFNGDGLGDVIIYFDLAAKGGNAIINQSLVFYLNTGKTLKVIAGFEPDYPFSFVGIKNNKIVIRKLIFENGDPRCCPSNSVEHTLKIVGNTVY